jgi:threonyl-tRNA synthetase
MSSQIKISLDGKSVQIASDQRPTHLFEDNSKVVVCRINGELADLWSELSDGDVVESVLITSEDGLNVLTRHS